ncbi:hypothetical protein V6N12_045891 [Hibiscus sabdariffa]|uniref:Uncharacterized protein n=1 Tax=Hibiscus sabdariffa TaxID=183260 RepID=A0ABR2G4C8_9ROSI
MEDSLPFIVSAKCYNEGQLDPEILELEDDEVINATIKAHSLVGRKAHRIKAFNQSAGERKSMICDIQTKHHHPKKTSMAREKLPGMLQAIGNMFTPIERFNTSLTRESKGKAATVANPVDSFEDPKVNICNDMILHGNTVIVGDQNKGSTNLVTPFVLDFSTMKISTPFNRKHVFEHLNDSPDAKRGDVIKIIEQGVVVLSPSNWRMQVPNLIISNAFALMNVGVECAASNVENGLEAEGSIGNHLFSVKRSMHFLLMYWCDAFNIYLRLCPSRMEVLE